MASSWACVVHLSVVRFDSLPSVYDGYAKFKICSRLPLIRAWFWNLVVIHLWKLQGFLRIFCNIFIKQKQGDGAVQNPY